MERNNLMSKCYPKIKDYCREKHGLEFQVNFIDFPSVHLDLELEDILLNTTVTLRLQSFFQLY